ncbi:hypothetical protein OH76DRAFT_217186 [Lentinus brumalis]|uniref:Uncharacterized protein n=1 Tax=Lentinus brumalis TaxID=2498619 RepID=A0A371CMD1_9APHY|nr:hypothetical protein OH76DRAFT_217186 [Polyporus brumalis]
MHESSELAKLPWTRTRDRSRSSPLRPNRSRLMGMTIEGYSRWPDEDSYCLDMRLSGRIYERFLADNLVTTRKPVCTSSETCGSGIVLRYATARYTVHTSTPSLPRLSVL